MILSLHAQAQLFLLTVLLGGGIYTHKALRRAGEPVIQEEPPTGESEAETE